MYHPAQQMEEPLSRRGELNAHKRSMRLDLDNAGPSQPTSEQAHTSSPLPTPDLRHAATDDARVRDAPH
ncbi:hypothetical protein MRX96_029922 [Rhipicephalus microplus]